MFRAVITKDPLSLSVAQTFLEDETCGGQDYFVGTVRNHNDGLKVNALEYQCYEPMCEKLIISFAKVAIEEFKVTKVFIAHRHGFLQLKDIAVIIATSGHHRDECFRATRSLIEKIKYELPVWKKEHYEEKSPQWVQCQHRVYHEHN